MANNRRWVPESTPQRDCLSNQLAPSVLACWCHFKAVSAHGGLERRTLISDDHWRAGSLQNWTVKICKGVFLTFLFLIDGNVIYFQYDSSTPLRFSAPA
jgi:hypothetical protein